ncbi:MAG: hypothetical protein HC906_07790 [Bacteroidales bacterium]|nr:hypothetical protein [Bacteroidales bacterium]
MNDNHHFVLYISALYHDQNSYFGITKYNANQTGFFSNIQYEFNYGKHDLKTGISYRHLNLDENISFTDTLLSSRNYNGIYQKTENIPGVFAENTLNMAHDKITWIKGIRVDHHNEHGLIVTPRTLMKFSVTPQSTLRANIGFGWRTVNFFSENTGLLASSRNIVFAEELKPEKAINYGINFTQKFHLFTDLTGHFTTDFYRTDFINQVFPDYDTDPALAILRNYSGESESNGFQAELLINFGEKLEIKTGYNYLDVYRKTGESKTLLPFNSKHRVLGTISYQPVKDKLFIDVNAHWYGEQRLPDTKKSPEEFRRPDFLNHCTDEWSITYAFKMVELYAGIENLLNFRQDKPIISWQNPFGPYFDTSSVWGPTKGREFYAGLRFKLKEVH